MVVEVAVLLEKISNPHRKGCKHSSPPGFFIFISKRPANHNIRKEKQPDGGKPQRSQEITITSPTQNINLSPYKVSVMVILNYYCPLSVTRRKKNISDKIQC